MRRLLATTAIAALTLGVGAASAFTPTLGTDGNAPGTVPRVIFSITDHHTVHSFSFADRHIFTGTNLHHQINAEGHAVWSFHQVDANWDVKGHWVHADEVHGSVCHLAANPSGCDAQQLQHYVTPIKPEKGP